MAVEPQLLGVPRKYQLSVLLAALLVELLVDVLVEVLVLVAVQLLTAVTLMALVDGLKSIL